MDKYAVDLNSLKESLTKKKAYRLEDVKDKIRKVAFDVVRFVNKDENIDGLWQVHHADDGDYIVAMYDDEPEEVEKTSSNWSVILDKTSENINIFYKNAPINKVAVASLGIPKEDANLVCDYLPEKLASNKKLAASLLADLAKETRTQILEQYPDLKVYIQDTE